MNNLKLLENFELIVTDTCFIKWYVYFFIFNYLRNLLYFMCQYELSALILEHAKHYDCLVRKRPTIYEKNN